MPFKSLAAALVLAAGLTTFPAAEKASARRHAQATAGAVTPCDAEAVVNDPDPQGMNVRSGPGSTFKVVGNLPNADVNGISVHITGAQGEWVRIDRADEQGGEPEDRVFFKGLGWVYAPLLTVDGVGGIEGGTKLYKEPSAKSRVVARMPVDVGGATVHGCKGKWLYVEHKKVRGWTAPGTTCSNALTNCN
jgi:SH3-like domain-containing protein